MFAHMPEYAGDPIFQVGEAYQQDPRSQKVNLSVGLYYDDDERVPVLASVTEAEKRLGALVRPRSYLPIEGLPDYRRAVQELVFGETSEAVGEHRVATIQSLGGTGALKVAADFLHDAYPDSEVWISDPAWENHFSIFEGAGIRTRRYPYYDEAQKAVSFDAMMDCVRGMAPHSILLLHACCHNPTGMDLSASQWAQLIALIGERRLIAVLDMAYQGFGDGLQKDAFAVRAMARAGLVFLVANSFSKNLSFYSERCGALSVVCETAAEADRVMGQLKAVARRTYSTPPGHGGAVTALVLTDPGLRALWEGEVKAMRSRIAAMREGVRQRLQSLVPAWDSSHFVNQRGMFTYTGLTRAQIQRLRDDYGVYIIESGRISVPGLNSRNIDYFCEAVADVLGAAGGANQSSPVNR